MNNEREPYKINISLEETNFYTITFEKIFD